jgi:hypothetical protein
MEPGERPNVAESFGSGAVTVALTVAAFVYFAAVFLEAAGSKLPSRWLPRPVLFFTQDAALFPGAAKVAIEYRAEGWLCQEQRWTELDTRPFFPIDADDKENRFYRAMHFFYEHRPTMQALDAFLVAHENAAVVAAAATGQGGGGGRIGGVRFSRVSVPVGTPGEPQQRYEHRPLDSFPESYRHALYWTRETKREERCGVSPP